MQGEEPSQADNNDSSDECYAVMVLDEIALTVALDQLRSRLRGRSHARVVLDHGFESATMLPLWASRNVPRIVPSGDPILAFELGVLLGLTLAGQHTGLVHGDVD